MISTALTFPQFDPVAIHLGPLAIRWYALAYIAGLLLGWAYLRRLVAFPPRALTILQLDDFLVWATLGVVLGGRLGYVLFYKPGFYLSNPAEIVMVWHGGMSFHGGMLGVLVAMAAFCRRDRLSLPALGDLVSCAAPIGLFFGRLANFVNGELFGRAAPADLPWAMIFPGGGPIPRHPSQLYEAGLEGLALGLIMYLLWRRPSVRLVPGTLAGAFLIGYALARITGEFFREPDAFLGFLMGGATMGQLLSLPMAAAGIALVVWARRRNPAKP